MTASFETVEGSGRVGGGGATDLAHARALHHLATADPEPERDGLLTGPAHEKKYGLERAENSAASWRNVGVHPTENRALVGDEDGAENLAGAAAEEAEDVVETTAAPATASTTSAPRASTSTFTAPPATNV